MKWIFYTIFSLTLFLKLIPSNLYNMPFTTDQGRDLVDVRQIWSGKDLRLIGPTTSINGVHLGPLYYYLISIPYLVSGGSPISILVWQIIFFHLSVLFLWKTIYQKDKTLASLVAIALLLSPITFYANRYFWNANFMISFTLLYFTLLLSHALKDKTSPKMDLLLGLVSGLSFQIEAAFGVLFIPFSLIYLFVRKFKLPSFSRFFLSIFVTLTPQLAFELVKGFPMTKVFLSELAGKTSILGQKLSLPDRIFDRLTIFKHSLTQSSHIPPQYLFVLLLLASIVFFVYKRKANKTAGYVLASSSLFFIFFSFFFYLGFSSQVKSWYTISLSLVFSIFIVNSLYLIPKINKLVLTIYIFISFTYLLVAQKDYLAQTTKPSNDPSSYSNQLKVIDDVYKEAKGNGFYLYNYLPSVYDFPFQYLFWYYGLRKYGYSPNDLAYLPNQPEYIKNMDGFLKNKKEVSTETKTILIIQKGENEKHLQEWLGNFARFCPEKTLNYDFNQEIVVLNRCNNKL